MYNTKYIQLYLKMARNVNAAQKRSVCEIETQLDLFEYQAKKLKGNNYMNDLEYASILSDHDLGSVSSEKIFDLDPDADLGGKGKKRQRRIVVDDDEEEEED